MKKFRILVLGLLITSFYQGQAFATCQPASKAQIKREIRKTIQFKLSKEALNTLVNAMFDRQCKNDDGKKLTPEDVRFLNLYDDFQGLDPAAIQEIANALNTAPAPSNDQTKVSDSKIKPDTSGSSGAPVPTNAANTATSPK